MSWIRRGPFTGVRMSLDGYTPPEKLWYAENWFPYNGVLIARPGIDADSAGGGATVGSTGAAQMGALFRKADGAYLLVNVVNGEIYHHNTLYISAAQLTAASITLHASNFCYSTIINDKIVISDGTNAPFMWTGESGTGLTALPNCPVLYGRPTTYYSKLVGIKNSDRKTVVWSEENDPTIGYEAGGYNNAWTIGQSGTAPLWAVAATNEALYYFRQSSIGSIHGAVSADFVTTGVHDDISTEIGSPFPQGPLIVGGNLWFYAEDSKPWVLAGGSRLVPIWEQLPGVFSTSSASQIPYASTPGTLGSLDWVRGTEGSQRRLLAYWEDYHAIIFFGFTNSSTDTTPLIGLVFDAADFSFRGFLTIKAAAGPSATLELAAAYGNNTFGISFVTRQRGIGTLRTLDPNEAGTLQPDNLGGTATNPAVRAVLGKQSLNPDQAQHFVNVRAEVQRDGTNISSFGVQYLTSQVPTIGTMPSAQAITPTVDRIETRAVGINGYGRWCTPLVTVTHASSSTRAQGRLFGLSLEALPDAVDPTVV